MNIREIGEIRRHLRRDRCNMTSVYGCYVNGQKEIVSTFRQSVALMPEGEAEKYFGVMKRVLSGTIGRNLIDISFKTSQVADGAEHKFLMKLRNSKLQDESLRLEFFQKVIESVSFNENYVILLGCDSYDVPFKSKDDEIQSDASDEVFTYLLCAICPVKQTKSSLRYIAEDKEFHDGGISQVLCAPEAGFLFPAFDSRATNIYNALFYTRNAKTNYSNLVDTIFQSEIPKPAAEQKKSFEALLSTSLGESCSLEVVQNVHDHICQCIELHKESKVPDPLLISKEQIRTSLVSAGVPEKNIAKFSVDYDAAFGYEAQLHPKNIIDNKHFDIKTPDISIRVSPDKSDLIETRVIGGVRYIMICADEDVEVNGVRIQFGENNA